MKNPPTVKMPHLRLDVRDARTIHGGYRQSQAPSTEGRVLTDEFSDDDFSHGGGIHVPRNPSRGGRRAERDERRLSRKD